MSGLRVLLLGPFQASIDSQALNSFRTSKVQALLVYLLVHAMEQPALLPRREEVMALLWPDLPRKSAQDNLRQTLYQLRRAIPEVAGPDGDAVPFILSDRQLLQVNPEARYDLDVASFTSLVRGGGREQLTAAVDLYRGDFLADFYLEDSSEFEAWAARWRGRLQRQMLEALDRLAAHHLECGEAGDAERVARRALEIDDLRESAHRQLMVALHRMGKRAEAIRQYEKCRELLREELGVTPEPETEAVVSAIRQGDVSGRRRSRLPVPESPLIGREAELADVIALLHDGARLVAIVGPGGMGKTRLALEVARRLDSGAEDGVADEVLSVEQAVFVNLAPLSEVEELVPFLARVLDLEFEKADRDELRRHLLDYLRGKNLLLVLDNFEHLLAEAPLLNEILQTAPGVKLLVTSRERLKLRAEHVYLLSGLGYSQWTTPVEAARDAAVQLFRHHARRVRPAFTLRREHLEPLRDILNLTDGMPLALILAAGWVKVLSPAEIAAELGSSLDLLEATHRDAPARQSSMRTVFNATWARLSQQEQALFAAISVFHGGFTLEAARAVAGATPRELMRLADRSLITRLQGGLFEVHELLRQFAAEQLEAAGEEDAVRDAHSAYYLETLANLLPDLKGRDQLGALDDIERDFENVHAAWRRACQRGHWEDIAGASQSLHLFARFRSRYLEGIELFEIAHRRITLHDTSNDQLAYAYVTAGRATLLDLAGLVEEALAAAPELNVIAKTVNDPLAAAFCQLTLGEIEYSSGRFDEALEALDAALNDYQETHEIFYTATVLLMLGWVTQAIGQSEKALDLIHRGLELVRQTGDRYLTASILRSYGGLLRKLEGPTEEAERYYREAAKLRWEIGARIHYASNLAKLASFSVWREGDLARARPLLDEALTIAEEQNVPYVRAQILAELTTHRLIEGDYQDAMVLTDEALELAPSHGHTWARASFQRGIAFVALGKIENAIPLMKASLSRLIEQGWLSFLRTFLPFLGIILRERGDHERAAELLAFGLTHPHASGRLEIDPLITRFRAELEGTLGEERFAAAWERSAQLDTLAVAAEVLEELESPDGDVNLSLSS